MITITSRAGYAQTIPTRDLAAHVARVFGKRATIDIPSATIRDGRRVLATLSLDSVSEVKITEV